MFDLHVHPGPCVTERRAGDGQTVAWYEAAGSSGCVLKGHCEPTVGRAATAGRDSEVDVYGGIVCNRPAGGLNPPAVAAALTMGARIVWLPTVDARAHEAAGLAHPPSCAPQLDAASDTAGDGERGIALPPVDPTNADTARTVMRLVADADAVLATGHVSGAEAAWVVSEANEAGLSRLLLTHPSFTVPDMDATGARELCDQGALAEITAYQLLRQPEADAARLAAFVTEVGPDRCVLSSDAGHPDMPPGPEALDRLIDALAGEGLDRGALEAMASGIPQELVAPG